MSVNEHSSSDADSGAAEKPTETLAEPSAEKPVTRRRVLSLDWIAVIAAAVLVAVVATGWVKVPW